MREPLDKMLNKLAVRHKLCAYETQPWVHYDEERGLTCSAEVRMGSGEQDLEAEIQLLKDEFDENEEGGGREQILWMRIEPIVQAQWAPVKLRVKGEDYVNAMYDWEGKGCQFFCSCIEAMQMGEMPDFDALVEENMSDDSKKAGSSGRVGRKSPKANPSALMGMKK